MPTASDNPFRVSSFMHGLATLLFRLFGWRTEGVVPQPCRFVLIAAPHTSNWDAFVMLTAAQIFRVKMAWFIKDAAFFFPLGPIIRFFGAVPIDRTTRNNVVAQAIARFEASDQLILAVPPEATRSRSESWKTGFYYIARGARVPIVLGYLDYRRKVAGLGPVFVPTGDIDADFRVFEAFYAAVTPKFPALRGAVRTADSPGPCEVGTTSAKPTSSVGVPVPELLSAGGAGRLVTDAPPRPPAEARPRRVSSSPGRSSD